MPAGILICIPNADPGPGLKRAKMKEKLKLNHRLPVIVLKSVKNNVIVITLVKCDFIFIES
jgi:hypothetical protein